MGLPRRDRRRSRRSSSRGHRSARSSTRRTASVSFRLGPGDVVLLSSDGLAESPGPGGEPLGYARARELFREAAPLPPEEALAAIARREEEWRGGKPREDDLTLVLVRRES